MREDGLEAASLFDMETLARSLWGEARGENEDGQVAVAWVMRNRVRAARDFIARQGRAHPLFGDGTLVGACRAPRQVSAWNPGDPNAVKLAQIGFDDAAYCRAFAIGAQVWGGLISDPTGGTTHYHRHDIEPVWAKSMKPTALIGAHMFYV
ncbi:MAG: cell wall hydrolase [Alphaproteobacteria bacterium]|nr:cell wall hydrolase [Alphaproteobacteria bacterium]